jgi:TPP-dependent pyruvate/acetoin dehydrogenase alpha subunit
MVDWMMTGPEGAIKYYHQMLRIRRFEETVLELFPQGVFYGTTHTYIGQEANAVGVLSHLQEGDVVVSNHRCHGHFLAYGGSMTGLAAELMGRHTGICGGRGGSQHIHWRDFYANGILGGTVPLAVGMALAERKMGSERIVFSFIGDGTLGEGVVYESLNMASLWNLPVLFIVENNRYAQSTPVELHLAGDIASRFEAFGIPAVAINENDIHTIGSVAGERVESVRSGEGPQALVIATYRFGPHSKGDDHRDPDEIAEYRAADPLGALARSLPSGEIESIQKGVEREVQAAFDQARGDPPAEPDWDRTGSDVTW